MTADVLPGSRGKSREDLLARASKSGYAAPTLLQAVAFNIVRYVSTRQRLLSDDLSDDPSAYTCCQEQSEGLKLIVGFPSSGLVVNCNRSCGNIYVAVVALRKF